MGTVFPYAPSKYLAWNTLCKHAQDSESLVRMSAVNSMGLAFPHIPDKNLARDTLCKHAQDSASLVRMNAARAIGLAFPYIPKKNLAWETLRNLTEDQDKNVRMNVARSLGSVYQNAQDRNQVLDELGKLIKDIDSDVRMFALYSLGRSSIIEASEAKDEDRLEKNMLMAVGYFEKSSQEGTLSNPARFCFPFYRSYIAITFKNANEEEYLKYLKEAKESIDGYKSREDLLNVVQNLSIALRESQKLKEKRIDDILRDLNAYRWYCEKAAEFMISVENEAPNVVSLLRRCNPLLEHKIRNIITDIQKSADMICEMSRGLAEDYKKIGIKLNNAAKSLSFEDISKTQKCSYIIISQMKAICEQLSDKEKFLAYHVIEEIDRSTEFPDILQKIESALTYISLTLAAKKEGETHLVDIVILTTLPEEYQAISELISNLKPMTLGSSTPNLYAWQFGFLHCPKFNGDYKIALGIVGRPGTDQSALAAYESVRQLKPRYVLLVGIAGGLSGLEKGDVVIADVIYGYEYGKLEKDFLPRGNWVYETDQGLLNCSIAQLLNCSIAYSLRNDWLKLMKAAPPTDSKPRVIVGEIASGNKIVDDPTNCLFIQVIDKWPKVIAVEMEGSGVGRAIKHAQNSGITVGFMMIRGISDLPRPEIEAGPRGSIERDSWKRYAASTAAAFTVGMIIDGLPTIPCKSV